MNLQPQTFEALGECLMLQPLLRSCSSISPVNGSLLSLPDPRSALQSIRSCIPRSPAWLLAYLAPRAENVRHPSWRQLGIASVPSILRLPSESALGSAEKERKILLKSSCQQPGCWGSVASWNLEN